MDNITKKEQEIIEIIMSNPLLEQEEIAKRLGISRSSVAGHLARLIKKGYLQRGYILNKQVEGVAVIGGSNVDIKGISDTAFRHGSSNPGKVFKAAGGVGRNVAENLARIELPTTLFSVIGEDSEGDWLLDITTKAGVNTKYVERMSDGNTGVYLSVLGENKEQVGSIADMQLIDRFTEELLMKHISILTTAKFIFVDTNLPQSSLAFILKYLKEKEIPVILDPVSAKKAVKIKEYLDTIYLITPNKEEAEILTDLKIESAKDLDKVAQKLFSLGVQNVVITLGSEGVFVATPYKQSFIPSPKVDVIDTTGAGDAFVAGIIYGLYNENDVFTACKYGHTMAAFTLAKEETVVTSLSQQVIETKMKEMFS